MPDVTLYFDIDPAEGLKRISANQHREVNRLDLEELHFHEKVREGYQLVMEKWENRFIRIDASQPLDVVFEQTKTSISKFLRNRS